MKKSNVSSIRYSDEVKEIIEKQKGNNFSEKLHNLVLYCYKKIPELKQEELQLEKRIHLKENQVKELLDQVQSMTDLRYEMSRFKEVVKKVNDTFKK